MMKHREGFMVMFADLWIYGCETPIRSNNEFLPIHGDFASHSLQMRTLPLYIGMIHDDP